MKYIGYWEYDLKDTEEVLAAYVNARAVGEK